MNVVMPRVVVLNVVAPHYLGLVQPNAPLLILFNFQTLTAVLYPGDKVNTSTRTQMVEF